MGFKTRNAYYLRISDNTVLQLYVYLDPAHVYWMTDITLQNVLEDLRPRIIPKLVSEASISANTNSSSSKSTLTATVEVHRGDTYQFAYFLRQTDHSHVVLLKNRSYVARPVGPVADLGSNHSDDEQEDARVRGSRRSKSLRQGREKSRSVGVQDQSRFNKRRRPEGSSEDDIYEDGYTEAGESQPAARLRGGTGLERSGSEEPSSRTYSTTGSIAHHTMIPVIKPDPDDPSQVDPFALLAQTGSETAERSPSPPLPLIAQPSSSLFHPEEDEESEEPPEEYHRRDVPFGGMNYEDEDVKTFKPALQLSYNGFTIFSKQLCLVIEPFPLLPPSHYMPRSHSIRRSRSGTSRATSSTPFSTGSSATPFQPPPNQSRSGSSTPSIPSFGRSGSSFEPLPSSRSGGSVQPGMMGSRAPSVLRQPTPFDGEDSDEDRDHYSAWKARSLSVLPRSNTGASKRTRKVDGDDEMEDEGTRWDRAEGGMVELSQVVLNARGSGRGTVGDTEGDDGEDGGIDIGLEDD